MSTSPPRGTPGRWVRDERVLDREVPGLVALVLGPEDDAPRSLRGTALEIWHELAQPASVAEVVARLAPRYEGDVATIGRDVQATVDRLVAAGVLRPAS